MSNTKSIDKYLNGQALVGDNYDPQEISQWFEDEREAYAELGAGERTTYRYDYHALNIFHGYRHLTTFKQFNHVCGFGSAYGDELLPIKDKIKKVTIIDSSKKFADGFMGGINASFICARPDGVIEAADGEFDLITCIGVLHHIPNVSFVLRELTRCLKPNGIMLLREPTTSMGDWRKHRRGLTSRERGIPAHILRRIIDECDLKTMHHSQCVFSPLSTLTASFGISVGSHLPLVILDLLFSRLSGWNYRYHRRRLIEKFAPASEFYVLTKQ